MPPIEPGAPRAPGESQRQLLLVSSRDWFATALRAVLEPEGLAFGQATTAEGVLQGAFRAARRAGGGIRVAEAV